MRDKTRCARGVDGGVDVRDSHLEPLEELPFGARPRRSGSGNRARSRETEFDVVPHTSDIRNPLRPNSTASAAWSRSKRSALNKRRGSYSTEGSPSHCSTTERNSSGSSTNGVCPDCSNTRTIARRGRADSSQSVGGTPKSKAPKASKVGQVTARAASDQSNSLPLAMTD
jgi:hypothetical protein